MASGEGAACARLSGFGLVMFTDYELEKMHYATLEVLEESGVLVLSDEAQEIYYSHGCSVDKKTNIVKIPHYVVEDALKTAPAKVLLAGRNPENDLMVGGRRGPYFTPAAEAVAIVDLETGKFRETTKKDVAEAALLCDALENIDFCWIVANAGDMPPMTQKLHGAEAALNNTSKHCTHVGLSSSLDARAFIQMGEAIVGGPEELRKRPIVSGLAAILTPLQQSKESCEVIIEFAKAGLPNFVNMNVILGATTPVTLAGGLVVANAEALGGIVLSQLVKKGTPVIYLTETIMMDLRTGNACIGSPEVSLVNAAQVRLAQYYNLPICSGGPANTDSHAPDAQSAVERTMNALLPALAGANIMITGFLETGKTWCHEMAVLDDDIALMVKRVVQGIEVNDENMAVDLIKQVHEIRDFLRQKHTLKFMAQQVKPRLFDRVSRGEWEVKGNKDLTQRAREEARRILKTHAPEPLSDGARKAIREIIKRVEKERKTA